MNISLNWLKEYVAIPKNISPEELGKLLTMHTVEVEEILNEGDKYDKVVVGKILEVKKHPNADRLQIALVDIGDRKAHIVCGAPNIAPGQMVPIALVGAELPNGMEIKEAEVRGEKSEGMLCAPDELGLGDDHSGIMILEGKTKIGQKFSDYLKLTDIILDIDNKSLSNRPDLWSHRGIAREVSAVLDVKYLGKKYTLENTNTADTVKVNIEDSKLCPRYMAVRIDGIKVEESPAWLKERLSSIGLRPISNIVDITNYVMHEIGQPLHAFDANLIDEIIIRRAKKDEQIETLDGKERKLDEDVLVIADSSKAVAIAGVMGGGNSEISDQTTSIIIESANFNASSVRKTSTKLSLRTDASSRFEKALDPNLCEEGIARTVELVLQICPGSQIASQTVDKQKFEINQGPIELSYQFICERIGADITEEKIDKILVSLGFHLDKSDDSLKITVPTWRATKDVTIPEDIVEEVLRIYGFDNITSALPKVELKPAQVIEELEFVKKIKNILAFSARLTEVYNYSFVGEEQLKKLGLNPGKYIALSNPIAIHHALLRQTLASNLIENIKTNQARFDEIGIFEIGQIFLSHEGNFKKDKTSEEKLPYQERRLGISVATGSENESFSKLKSIIGVLFAEINLNYTFVKLNEREDWMDEKRSAKICLSDKKGLESLSKLGYASIVNRKIAKGAGLKKSVAIAEIYLDELYKETKSISKMYAEPSRYPALERDLAFVVDKSVTYNELKKAIYAYNELISDVELFDVYEGDKIGANKKNIAFHISYLADRTLTSEEVDELQAGLFKDLEEKYGATVRNY